MYRYSDLDEYQYIIQTSSQKSDKHCRFFCLLIIKSTNKNICNVFRDFLIHISRYFDILFSYTAPQGVNVHKQFD